ncbi:SDR family oxidoreductase [Streptosporangium sp. NBC_01755]|uniref:SDR family NAD(P)-dependent oxidoreductase n=1 Tax=unclassified Streptosporangium TaxID=2632669 RepID=UPI002DD92ED6|nr:MULTISPECIES: SDR family NAD(P)-dependent oxidoreductase [unclassified Streptosporangium]WSA25674.1 SDR family oxidoreductase [Streptosporangium sp. NBC_01810]WSD02936.1 SDR family oxidoreductase [Streptosporangium sp. NBC_01755]
MSFRLSGKNVLVTGGSRGIGRSVVLGLAEEGCNVVTCYRADKEAAERLEHDLASTPGKHSVVQADVSRQEEVNGLIGECRTRLGSLDVVVHNAGAISHVPFAELELDEWHRILDTNLTGMYLVVRGALPLMSEGGSVIAIGSKAAMVGVPLRTHYTASKAGELGLARSLSKELGPRGIRINVVAPGIINTHAVDDLSPEHARRYRTMTALGRLGEPEEVADVVLFLSSDRSRYMTGETVHVDGGI